MSRHRNSPYCKIFKEKIILLIIFLQILYPISSTDKFLNVFFGEQDEYSNKTKNEFTNMRIKDIIQENQNFDKFTIPLAKYFLKLSSYAYCEEQTLKQKKCCPELFLEDGWELVFEKKVSYDDYTYSILKNDKFKKIVATFPGTAGPLQLIKELYYSNGVIFKDDPTEKIMHYLKNVYLSFEAELDKDLSYLFEIYKGYQFIFTGHSLGASIAAISVLDSIKHGYVKRSKFSPMLITYGQPRVGNDILANEIMKNIPIIYRVSREGDIVCNIPLCSWTLSPFMECNGILPEFRFNSSFIPDENAKKVSENNFYIWHYAGLLHFNDNMDDYVDCGIEFGENHPRKECQLSTNFNIYKHLFYFGVQASMICST